MYHSVCNRSLSARFIFFSLTSKSLPPCILTAAHIWTIITKNFLREREITLTLAPLRCNAWSQMSKACFMTLIFKEKKRTLEKGSCLQTIFYAKWQKKHMDERFMGLLHHSSVKVNKPHFTRRFEFINILPIRRIAGRWNRREWFFWLLKCAFLLSNDKQMLFLGAMADPVLNISNELGKKNFGQ